MVDRSRWRTGTRSVNRSRKGYDGSNHGGGHAESAAPVITPLEDLASNREPRTDESTSEIREEPSIHHQSGDVLGPPTQTWNSSSTLSLTEEVSLSPIDQIDDSGSTGISLPLYEQST